MDQYEMLRKVSRTFALSVERLPPTLQDILTIAYLLFRVSDCLEDHETMQVERKVQLLRLWARVLSRELPPKDLIACISDLDPDDPEVYVAQHAGGIIGQLDQFPAEIQEAIRLRVTETSLGMARWQEHGPFVEDEEALDDYMHQVAGKVGYLLTDIFAWYSPAIRECKARLMPQAREFGLALQTVNVIRGMRKDYERGWVFVPRTFYEQVGLTRDGLFDPANVELALQVIDMLADKAERHLWHGIRYIWAFPRCQHRIRLACMWPYFFAVKTLALSRNNVNVLLADAKMSRDQVKKIMRDTKLFGWSNRWLAWYNNYLACPLYQSEVLAKAT
ncbi:MAG: squalene/phytoene synthase family protein [Chloroflexota bacterium]|nr:squalene/phytoene synthase family protein [Chloroflexota bacterium]